MNILLGASVFVLLILFVDGEYNENLDKTVNVDIQKLFQSPHQGGFHAYALPTELETPSFSLDLREPLCGLDVNSQNQMVYTSSSKSKVFVFDGGSKNLVKEIGVGNVSCSLAVM